MGCSLVAKLGRSGSGSGDGSTLISGDSKIDPGLKPDNRKRKKKEKKQAEVAQEGDNGRARHVAALLRLVGRMPKVRHIMTESWCADKGTQGIADTVDWILRCGPDDAEEILSSLVRPR